MKRLLTITREPLDEATLAAGRALSGTSGAVVCFTGVVRDREGDRPVTALDYEVFERMAERQFALIFDEMERRWPVASVRLAHRAGVVKVGEPSLWVEVIAPHRAEAFAACQFLIDEMKRTVPIWKRPLAADRAAGG